MFQRVIALLVASVSACGGSSGTPAPDGGSPDAASGIDAAPAKVALAGGVEKGPFLLGSSVSVSVIDDTLAPTGITFDTQTTDDEGRFAVSLAPGPISVEATGFYYNEITGLLSNASTVLRAYDVVSPGATHSTFLNVITHLSYPRIQSLVTSGSSIGDAMIQAEDEVRLALRVGLWLDPGPATELSELAGDTDPAAYLLAVSAVLMNAATIQAAGGSVDAALQSILNTYGADLASDGVLAPLRTTALLEAHATIDPDVVMTNMAAHLVSIGSSAVVPDIQRILDRDQDGIVDRNDNCPIVANPDQADANGDGVGNVCAVYSCGDGLHVGDEICFQAHPTGVIPPALTVRTSIVTGDFNGDGLLDVAYDNGPVGAAQGMNVLVGDGTGDLAPPIFTSFAGPTNKAVGLIDGDAIADIVIDADPERTLLGDSAGAFTLLESTNVTGTHTYETRPSLYDYDMDGSLDLVNVAPNAVNLYPGLGDGTFGAAEHTVMVSTIFDAVPADFDGDGHVDLAAITNYYDFSPSMSLPISLVLISGGPMQLFATQTTVLLKPAGHRPRAVIVGDVDSDGLSDVVVAFLYIDSFDSYGTITVLINNGDGTFAQHDVVTPGVAANILALADIDNDGDQDVLAGSSGVLLHRGDGTGTMGAAEELLPPGNYPFTVADMNADGYQDLVASQQDAGGYGLGLVVHVAGGW